MAWLGTPGLSQLETTTRIILSSIYRLIGNTRIVSFGSHNQDCLVQYLWPHWECQDWKSIEDNLGKAWSSNTFISFKICHYFLSFKAWRLRSRCLVDLQMIIHVYNSETNDVNLSLDVEAFSSLQHNGRLYNFKPLVSMTSLWEFGVAAKFDHLYSSNCLMEGKSPY